MSGNNKKERFTKITEARINKIDDMLRLIGNCANKNNYSYTDSDVIELFSYIERSVVHAKTKYEFFSKQAEYKQSKYNFENGCTLAEGFMRTVIKFPLKTALICPKTGEIWNYRELNEDINRLADSMISAGIKHGDKVMYQLKNCPEFVFVYIACRKIGAVGCPVYTNLAPANTSSLINSIEPKIFFYENSGDTELALTMTKCSPLLVVVNSKKGKHPLENHILYDDFIASSRTDEPITSGEKNVYDETTLFFTSGTTGRQKCVPVTDINEVMSVNDVIIHLDIAKSDTILTLTPWSHRGGLHCGGPATALYTGAALVAADVSEMSEILKYIEKYRVSFVSGMPSDFNTLSNAQKTENRNLAALKRIISIGSSLSYAEYINLQQTLCDRIYNGYGTTETFWNTILTPEKAMFYPGSIGEACVGDDVRIVKIYDDHCAEPDELVPKDNASEGEIIIKSCSKSAGYYKNGSDSGSKYYKGFLYTRDTGTWDENGIITVAGRNDDMIICGEEKVYPKEIEDILMQNPKVADCIVTSAKDTGGSELIAAYVIKADGSLTFDELDEHCKASLLLSNGKIPKLYRFKRSLPLTPNGKKQHKKAKQMAAADIKNGMFHRI